MTVQWMIFELKEVSILNEWDNMTETAIILKRWFDDFNFKSEEEARVNLIQALEVEKNLDHETDDQHRIGFEIKKVLS